MEEVHSWWEDTLEGRGPRIHQREDPERIQLFKSLLIEHKLHPISIPTFGSSRKSDGSIPEQSTVRVSFLGRSVRSSSVHRMSCRYRSGHWNYAFRSFLIHSPLFTNWLWNLRHKSLADIVFTFFHSPRSDSSTSFWIGIDTSLGLPVNSNSRFEMHVVLLSSRETGREDLKSFDKSNWWRLLVHRLGIITRTEETKILTVTLPPLIRKHLFPAALISSWKSTPNCLYDGNFSRRFSFFGPTKLLFRLNFISSESSTPHVWIRFPFYRSKYSYF